jgi:predicted CXXCH cytochrome family protein
MSKLKIGFSTLMTLVFVGLFSIIALAAAPDQPTNVNATTMGYNVTITWDKVDGATYNVYWNGASTPVNVTTPSFTQKGLQNGDYTYSVSVVTSAGESTAVTGKVSVNFTPTTTNPAPGINVGDRDNFGNVSTHKTHGNFQNNTNSCANCHSTHNGGTKNLLMKSDEKDLCMSCHDGTMGFYNVDNASGAGIFNSTHDSASMHAVGTVKISAAPGSYNAGVKGTISVSGKDVAISNAGSTLECSSCHNPHGSVNDRLLREGILTQTVAGKYGPTEQYIPWSSTVALGTKAINLDLQPDPNFDAINKTSGLSITISNGPKLGTDAVQYSQFCSACHDDYLKGSGTPESANGHYTHTTNSSAAGRNCASCHYAHGTDITTLHDTAGKTVADYVKAGWSQDQAEAYMKNVTQGGSKLKKYTNMAVCWSCHQSSHVLDTPGAATGPGGSVPSPIPGGDFSGKPKK